MAFSKCEESGRYENFVRAQHPCDTFTVGDFRSMTPMCIRPFEGASYLLQTYPDKKLESYIDSVLNIVAKRRSRTGICIPPAR